MRFSFDSAYSILRSHLCAVSAIAVLAAAPVSTVYAQPVQTSAESQLASIEGLSDERFLTELERLQQDAPGEARSLANAAKAQRPHLAARIDELTAVLVGPDYSLALALGVGVATAAAIATSQGGGQGGGQARTIETILPPLPPGWETNPSNWETPEYNADYSKPRINASAAYARGGTGTGIKAGIFDSGVYGAHLDLAPNIAGCFRMLTGDNSLDTTHCQDAHGHGTHVAGTVAARRDGVVMHGVAFDANILSVNISNAVGGLMADPVAYTAAMQWTLDNGALVSNHSYGYNVRHIDWTPQQIANMVANNYGSAFDMAANNNHILVWATGNSTFNEPGPEAALPLYMEHLRSNWVAVTSINADGSRSSYANHCGLAAAWCIAAPGGDAGGLIISAGIAGGYVPNAGTSMAAPQVTGAMAILLQLFGPGTVSNLTPQQVRDVMFRTADKNLPGYAGSLNADGLSTIYGHGALDLDAATTPNVYQMSLAGHSLSGSKFVLSGALGATLDATLSQRSLAVFDDLGRGITVDLAAFAAEAGTRFDYNAALRRLGQPSAQEIQLATGMTFTFRNTGTDQFMPGSTDMRISTELTEGTYFQAGMNTAPAHALGFFSQGELAPEHMIDPSALSAPYLGLTDSATTSGIHTELWNGDLTVMAFGGMAGTSGKIASGLPGQPESWTYGTAAEWTTSFGDSFGLSVRGGLVAETHELLGSRFTGAFGLEGATTSFAGAGVRVGLTPNLDLIGSYDIGVSNASAAFGSLFTHIDPLVSDAFSLGLVGRNVFSNEDQFGIVLSQPMRVSSGTAGLSLPQGNNAAGPLAATMNLAPDGQELRLQGFYMAPAMGGHLGLGAMLRFEPNHVAGANTDVAGMASFRRAY